jgi:CelD/BcsL family acetyltransferase involved in cellulose biosynthesis
MKVSVIRASELDDACKSQWTEIQQSNSMLASPYFCVEFTEALAAIRHDVYVAIIEDGSDIVGFFPYHRRRSGFGRPVGLGLSDCHGVIANPDADWSADELLRGCGLVRWEFDHLIASQTQFQSYHQSVEPSPIIEVANGFEAYKERRMQMGGGELKTIQRRARKLRNEHEGYRFIEFDSSLDRLDQVFTLKSAQCRETGAYDYFSIPWTREFVRRLSEIRTPNFSGILSSLMIGEQCVAVHFGIRSNKVWHWWFPSYEKSFGRYSPGLILLMEVIQTAANNGFSHIDLGKDLVRYKQNLMTGSVAVASGAISGSSILNGSMKALQWLEREDHNPYLKQLLRLPRGLINRAKIKWRYN